METSCSGDFPPNIKPIVVGVAIMLFYYIRYDIGAKVQFFREATSTV
jgi:hypothetical protein